MRRSGLWMYCEEVRRSGKEGKLGKLKLGVGSRNLVSEVPRVK
jgi:hypothetical protein